MAITPDAGRLSNSTTLSDLQAQRSVRQTQLEAKVQEATLTSAQTLSPAEIQEHQNFYNTTVADVDAVRSGKVGNFASVDAAVAKRMFPFDGDMRTVGKATTPNPHDNKEAAEVKSEYNKDFKEARKERARAQREVDKMGPGHHKLSNGDEVDIKKDPKTGVETVTTKHGDGTTETVHFDEKNPDKVTVEKTAKDGTRETLEQDGTTVSKSKTDKDGKTVKDTFTIDDKGRAVRERTGPNSDDDLKTTVNPDGSTDDRKLIYKDENGHPVYEDKHHDPRVKVVRPTPHPPVCPSESDQKKIDEATKPNPADNPEAAKTREEYKKLAEKAKAERARAAKEVEKLGPGEHKLSNGDKVTVTVDSKTGEKTVKTESPDGTTKTVSYNDKSPDSVKVSEKRKDGSEETLEQNGTTMTDSKTDKDGKKISEKYSIDDKGRPVRDISGPGEDDDYKTTVNPDGSTDDRNEIYKGDDGKPVYEDKHHEAKKPHHRHHHHPVHHHHYGEKKIDKATEKNPHDNKEAGEVKKEYKKAAAEAKHERDIAAKEASKLGPGEHKLSNGDKVTVTIDEKTHEKTVKTVSHDGTTKEVKFNDKDAEKVSVTKTHKDGSKETLTEDGTTIARSKTGHSGETTSERFSIDDQGRPVREKKGPRGDDDDKTTVNPDGSTDDRNLIYRDDKGHPVYEDKHHRHG